MVSKKKICLIMWGIDENMSLKVTFLPSFCMPHDVNTGSSRGFFLSNPPFMSNFYMVAQKGLQHAN